MNYHQEGDRLEQVCRETLLTRWPDSHIIETKINHIHGIDFAVELRGGGVAIVEVKNGTGSVRNPQMSVDWIRARMNNEWLFMRFGLIVTGAGPPYHNRYWRGRFYP